MKMILSAVLAVSLVVAFTSPGSAVWDTQTFWEHQDRASP